MKKHFIFPVLFISAFLFSGKAVGQEVPQMNQLPFSLEEVSAVRMADFNGDTLLDLVTVSAASPATLSVLKNNGDDTFTEMFSLPAFARGQLEIVDANQDNFPDIFLIGYAKPDSIAAFVLQGKNGFAFQENSIPLQLKSFSSYAWMDLEDTQFPALFISGISSQSESLVNAFLIKEEEGYSWLEAGLEDQQVHMIREIPNPEKLFYLETSEAEEFSAGSFYRFNDSSFSPVDFTALDLKEQALAQGDLNHDGWWDIFLYGKDQNENTRGLILYGKEEGFDPVSLELGGISLHQAEILDLTNDGRAELVLLGEENGESAVYLASESTDYSLGKLPVKGEKFYLADYDKDGIPELMMLDDAHLYLYKNATETENTAPLQPRSLLALPLQEGTLISWSNGSDDKTPKESLTYEIMLTNSKGGNILQSSLIDPESGLDKTFGYGSLGTAHIFQYNQPFGDTLKFYLSTFDNAHHTSFYEKECSGLASSKGVLYSSSCISTFEKDTMVCEASSAVLSEIFDFDAQYWVSYKKGLLGTSGTEFQFVEDDQLYGVKIVDDCIELFTGRILFGPGRETTSIHLEACPGDSLLLSAASEALSYNWRNSQGLELGTADSLVYQALQSDTILLERGALSGACPTTDTFFIEVYPLEKLGVMGNTTIRAGAEVQLSAWGPELLEWRTKEGPINPGDQNPLVRPERTTTYYVRGRNVQGCELQDSLTINVVKDLFVPSLFSPNGDAHNDRLSVMGSGVKELSFRVYDPLGNLVFEANSSQQARIGWDGRQNGKKLPAGNYAWVLTGFFEDGSPLEFENKRSGFITLIR